MKQANAKSLLKSGEALADRRPWHPQELCSSRDAAELDNGDEFLEMLGYHLDRI